MMLALSMALTQPRQVAGGAAPAIDGASPTTFATAPAVHYHPHSQSGGAGYTTSSGQVTGCPSLGSVAAALVGFAADGTTVTGPLELTDALGRKFWRFNGTQYAKIENALSGLASRGYMALMVGRVHHHRNTVSILMPRFGAYTDDANNTAASSVFGMLRTSVSSASANYLNGPNTPVASSNATDCYKAIPGAQLNIMALASRTTANGGQRVYNNNATCDIAQAGTAVTGYLGAILGASAGASNTANVTTSINNVFDLYELAIWTAEIANASADPLVAAAVTNYAVTALSRQIVLEGDSITDGIATTLPTSPAWADNLGSIISAPGAGYVPADCRVINLGTSGNTIASLVTKRDGTNAVFSAGKYPGGAANNIVAVQIGRNDVTTLTGAQVYANLVPLLHTASTGYLERGWSVVQVGNTCTSNGTLQGKIQDLRALIADTTNHVPNATFLTDCDAAPGGTFDGLLTVLHLYDVTVGGDTIFKTAADALDTASGYIDSDGTHWRIAGCLAMVTGGDTPQYGYASIL